MRDLLSPVDAMRPSVPVHGEPGFLFHASPASADTHRLLLLGRVGFIIALLLLVGSYWFPSEWNPFVFAAEGILFIVILACYRVASRRALRQIAATRDARVQAASK